MTITAEQKPEYFEFASSILDAQFEHGPGCKALTKLHDDGRIAAVVLYTRFSHLNCELSIASDGSRAWVNRQFIRAVFDYPFNQLGKRRVMTVSREDAPSVLDQQTRLGFVPEGLLRGWYGDTDGILFGMLREECVWLKGK